MVATGAVGSALALTARPSWATQDASAETLLRQALVASTNKDAVLSVVISARTAADETSLLRQVAQGLSINQASLEAILTKVAQLAISGQDVYLMVDDAEQLQDSALEVLLLGALGYPNPY